MLRLLIVDDEPIITDNYADVFSEVADLELDIERAYSGQEALEWMRKTRIDIVLSDICMPGVTGLDVQREIRLQWPQCRVVFLSGHEEFGYIQAALRNQGTDYVLKTESTEVVVEAVRKAAREIEREQANEKLLETAATHMRLALPVLRERYLLDVVEGIEPCGAEMRARFAELGVELDPRQAVLLMVGRVDAASSESREAGKDKALYGARKAVEEYFRSALSVASVARDRMWLLWMMQPGTGDRADEQGLERAWERVALYLKGTMDSVQRMCKNTVGVSVSLAVDTEPVPWESVYARAGSLEARLAAAAGLGGALLLVGASPGVPEAGAAEPAGLPQRAYTRKVPLLRGFLEAGERGEFMALFAEIMRQAGEEPAASGGRRSEVFHSMCAVLLGCFSGWSQADRELPEAEIAELGAQSRSWSEVTRRLASLAERIFDKKREECSHNATRIVRIIEEYAVRHLDGDVSLTRLADVVHLNPFYLSRFFKETTGRNLSEYISETKVLRAKEMLLSSNMKIHEVTSRLGFQTSSYFARFFRKHTGLTPQEYRDSAAPP